MRASPRAPLAALFLGLAACQEPDVGQPCTLDFNDEQVTVPDPNTPGDYLETGQPVCENLVCVQSGQTKGAYDKWNPYCSKACAGDKDCFPDETKLRCRQLVPLANSFPPEVAEKYLRDLTFSKYCAVPRPETLQ
jgi:hypothetical protein